VRLTRFIESIYFFLGLYFTTLFSVSTYYLLQALLYATSSSILFLLSARCSFIFRNEINLTYLSSTHTPPPKTPLSTSTTRKTDILPAPAGEVAQPHSVEEAEAEVEVAVVRDLVRDALAVWMMFVGRSARAVNKETVKAVELLLKCNLKEEKSANGPRCQVLGPPVCCLWPGSLSYARHPAMHF
jgi:deoxyribose-phosphate aldolase